MKNPNGKYEDNPPPSQLIERMERYHELQTAAKFCELAERGQTAQAEAIVRHYLAHVNLIKDLNEFITYRRRCMMERGPKCVADLTQVDAAIDHLVRTVQRNHRDDLGISLEWKIS